MRSTKNSGKKSFNAPPQLNAADRRLFQYTGVARPDEPGVVQIGYSPERIKRARQLAESINKTVSALKNHPHPARAENESEITTMLKNSLKPADIPESPNYKFTAEIFTATEIGGNLCDVFKINKDYLAAFFVDVTEKGISQGLYMMKVKNMLRKALLKNPPEKALHLVNDELFNTVDKKIPLKAFLCVLNLRSGVLQTFNAGHVDPVLKSPNRHPGFIKGPFSQLLGSSSDTTFIPMPLQLNKGDKFYLYSNDILDLPNACGEKYGRNRLLDVISSSGDDAQAVIHSIRQDVMAFTGETSLKADVAIAVLEYTPTVEE